MANPKNSPVEEVDEDETVAIRPNDLAKELGVDGKRVRAFLRSNFTRPAESKNTNWELTEEMIDAVNAKFGETDEDEDEDADDEA